MTGLLVLLIVRGVAPSVTPKNEISEPIVVELPIVVTEPVIELEPKQEIIAVPIIAELPVNSEIKDIVVELPKKITIQEIKATPVTVTEVAIIEEIVEPVVENEPATEVESIEEVKITVTYEAKEPISTMSYLDEPTMEVVVGFVFVIGAFNDLQDGGTILYGRPSVKMDLTKIDGLGFGATAQLGYGQVGSDSLLTSAIIGASYTKKFEKTSLSVIGGVYGSHMQYRRDDSSNELSSLGLGLDIKFMLPETKSGHRWGVTSNIASGFIGDPNGSITLGFVFN